MTEFDPWSHITAIDAAEAARAFRASGGVQHHCIDNFLRADFAQEVAAVYPTYDDAKGMGKHYSALHETGKVQITDSSLFPAPVAALNRALASREFRETMVEITGIEELLSDPKLVGGGMHVMGPGARLDVHVDFNKTGDRELYRRLNILVFLNPNWQEGWGGKFELWDPAVENRLAAYTPEFNRCLFFATNEISYHGVTPVRCPAGESRRSFAAYYYTERPHPDWSGEHHSTIFRHRPGEGWRAALGVRDHVRRVAKRGSSWLGRRFGGGES